PVLFLPWSTRHPCVRIALWVLMPFAFFHLTYHAYFPHYSAPVTGLFLLLILQGWRHLRVWRWKRQPVGRLIARALPIVSFVLLVVPVVGGKLEPPLGYRERFARTLQQAGGQHLVFVRYKQPGHHPNDEWVYNRADIDRSDIVWARLWTVESNNALKRYFAGRRIWIAEPDAKPPRLTEEVADEKSR
ncbi:MAG TPA: hypothetical protein VF135_07605, partial [Terriglobales bacterium]